MYKAAGVSGPVAFAQLPPETQLFWKGWLAERLERENEQGERMAEHTDL